MTGVGLQSAPDVIPPRSAGGLTLPCREYDSELWFSQRPAEVERAKALCQDCPVLEWCRTGALERQEPWGVWGGELCEDGVVVPRKKPRGRPPKTAAAA